MEKGDEDRGYNQREQGCYTQAEDNRDCHGTPPLRRFTPDIPGQFTEIEADSGGHGQKSQNGGDGGQHDRSKPDETGLHQGLPVGEPFLGELVVVIDQNNGVVHYHTSEADDPDASHDGAEGRPGNQEAEKDAD